MTTASQSPVALDVASAIETVRQFLDTDDTRHINRARFENSVRVLFDEHNRLTEENAKLTGMMDTLLCPQCVDRVNDHIERFRETKETT